jgi:hypothetical protein
MARAEILKAFRVQFGDVSTRAVDGYLRRAKERWQIEAIAAPSLPAARTQEREAFLAKLDQDVAVFVAAGVLAPITRLRTLEAEVRGLRILRPQEPPVAPPQPPGATTNILNLTLGRSPEDLAHETRLLKRVIAMREGTAQPDPDLDAIEAEGTSLESDRSAE